MKFVSLFAGVGGFDLGLERAGMECVGQVEIDKHAKGILARHWPNVPKHDDVKTAKDWADNEGITGTVDLVCGGFPCQDVSVAGRRAGLAGSRTSLFWDALNFATHVKAQWIVLENVPGLFSSNNGHDFAAVIGALRHAGFHYIEWRVFDSQFYGVPQRRRRVFIVGHTRNPSRFPLFVDRESSGRDFEEGHQARQATAASIASGVRSGVFGAHSFGGYADGVKTLAASDHKDGSRNIVVGTLAARDYKGVGNQYVAENKLVIDTFVKPARAQSAESPETWRADQVHPTVNAFDTGDTRATALVVFPMQSTVIGRADHNGPQGKGYGLEKDPMFTIDRVGAHGVAIIEGHNMDEQKAAVVRMRAGKEGGGKGALVSEERSLTLATSNDQTLFASSVRRLTPVECERLQGFPDGWTDGQADSHRYKQMGNAVTVNVAEIVAQSILKCM